MPAVGFKVNHTEKVPGADIVGIEHQSETGDGAFFPRAPNMVVFKLVCVNRAAKKL